MNLRCREGDMALIINEEPGCESNIGRAVILHGPIKQCAERGPSWYIEPVHAEPWYAIDCGEGGVWCGVLSPDDGIYHPDAWLLPLRPKCDESSEETEETSPVTIEEE